MFSVSTSVVLLVFSVSQALGQTSLTVTTNVPAPSPSQTVVLSGIVSATSNLPTSSSTTTTLSSKKTQGQTSLTVTPNVPAPSPSQTVVSSGIASASSNLPTSSSTTTTPSSKKTSCAKLSVVINILWINDFGNKASEKFQNLSRVFSSALEKVYSDSEKYINVEVSEVHFTEKDDKVLAEANLSLVFEGGDEVFIEDVFKKEVATGELDGGLTVIKDSTEFDPLGVSWKDWKAKDGECEEKCEGAGAPFFIVRECEDARCSCKGHKTTKETKKCTTYCSSTVAVSVSFVILVTGIFLSSSFQ